MLEPAYRNDVEWRQRESLRTWRGLHACDALVRRHLEAQFDTHFDISLAEFDLLAAVAEGGGSLSRRHLARAVMLSEAELTSLLSRLFASGHVQVDTPDHGGAVMLALTPAGLADYRTISTQYLRWVQALLEGLTDEDMALLQRLIRRVHASVMRLRETRELSDGA